MIAMATVLLWFCGLNLCAFKLLGSEGAKAPGCPCCHTDGSCAKPAASFCDKYISQEAASNSHLHSIVLACAGLPVVGILSLGDVQASPGLALAVHGSTHPPADRGFAGRVLTGSLFSQAPPVA